MKAGRNKIELVCSDIEAARVSADMRIVAEARSVRRVSTEGAVVVRSSLGSVVLHREAVDVPKAGWISSRADSDVQVIGAGKTLREDICAIQRQHDMEPALRLRVEEAARIGNRWPELKRILCSIDGWSITIKAVEIYRGAHRIARSVKNS